MNKNKKEKNSHAENNLTRPRLLRGEVVSDKMDKTAVVLVNKFKQHPKYKKRYLASKKYKAHNENNQYKIGDNVVIKESRPISGSKKWIIIAKHERYNEKRGNDQ